MLAAGIKIMYGAYAFGLSDTIEGFKGEMYYLILN